MYTYFVAALLGLAIATDTGDLGIEKQEIANLSDEIQLLKFGYRYDTSTGMDPTIYSHLGFGAGF